MAFLRKFIASPYFNPIVLFGFSIISSIAVALFPYHDMSVRRAFSLAVLLVMVSTMVVSLLVITWIMGVSFYLDKKYDWHTLHSGRYTRQILFGGLVPLGMVVLYELLYYGYELIDSDTYYFVFALQLFMLYLINERGYMIYLGQQRKVMERQLESAAEDRAKYEMERQLSEGRYMLLEQQLETSQTEKKELAEQFQAYQNREQNVQEQILKGYMMLENFLFGTKEATPYVLKIGNKEVHIEEKHILGFEIAGGSNKKPFIYIRTAGGESSLTNEESMDRIHEDRFPTYLRLSRQWLVSPKALLSYTVDEQNGGCMIMTGLDSAPIYVSKARWQSLEDRVRLILAWPHKAS